MTIWFDITNISTFNAGVVGIIRAELELAYNFGTISKQTRFCRLNARGDGIEEVSRDDLGWLLRAKTPVDGYLERIELRRSVPREPSSAVLPDEVREFRRGRGRMEHAKLSFQKLASILPPTLFTIVYYAARPFFYALSKTLPRKNVEGPRLGASSVRTVPVIGGEVDHPFVMGDVLFSCGWKDTNKEALYAKVRKALNLRLHISYLIYDTILINPQTKYLYEKSSEEEFLRYFRWVSSHCDLIFYGGNTARLDSQRLQENLRLPVPAGIPVRFGDVPNDALTPLSATDSAQYLQDLGLESGRYLLCVGSIEPRKNHQILYKAYRELLERTEAYQLEAESVPKLVIAGSLHGAESLVHALKYDSRTKDLVIFVRPTDEGLDCLYRNCLFTLMPTLYEGWNLTLPESLSYRKFCISSDVPPMREIGKDLIAYAEPHDAAQWANLIATYCRETHLLQACERRIDAEWQNKSWRQAAEDIHAQLASFDFKNNINNAPPSLWFDLTLINNHAGSIDGIPRVELSMAWELYQNPESHVRFFEFARDGGIGAFVELTSTELPWLRKSKADYVSFYRRHMDYKHDLLRQARDASRGPVLMGGDGSAASIYSRLVSEEPSRSERLRGSLIHLSSLLPVRVMEWLYTKFRRVRDDPALPAAATDRVAVQSKTGLASKTGRPADALLEFKSEIHDVVAHPFEDGDRVISMGLDWDATYLQAIDIIRSGAGIETAYFVHDMIPLIEPQFYQPHIHELYEKFFYWACRSSDVLFFGGNTAKADGERLLERYRLTRAPALVPLRLGAEFDPKELLPKVSDKKALQRMGIRKRYVLSVGTIQIRKNHEVLYRALVSWLEEARSVSTKDIPLFVFAGKVGWLVDDLVKSIRNDERVSKHLLILQPSDEDLRILYRNCLFTLLPSFYEGAALPISESLAYGKFCIAADVPPLRETGASFLSYVAPRDVRGWKDAIRYYAESGEALAEREIVIRENRSYVSWHECSVELLERYPASASRNLKALPGNQEKPHEREY